MKAAAFRLATLILLFVSCDFRISAADAKLSVTVTTQPRFEEQGRFTYLVISEGRRDHRLLWATPEFQYIPISLDTNKVYTFKITAGRYKAPKLQKVQQDSRSIYDVEVCEIHKTKMDYKEVKVFYGLILPAPDDPSSHVESQLFPHRREYLLGGCVVMPDSPKSESVYVCRDCKAAFEKWRSARKNGK